MHWTFSTGQCLSQEPFGHGRGHNKKVDVRENLMKDRALWWGLHWTRGDRELTTIRL